MAVHTNGAGATTLTGVVALANEAGLKLDSQAGWLNYSKWRDQFPTPEQGRHVAVKLDAKGFVRNVTPLDGPPDAPGSAVASRETAIIRQTCLKAAAAFCAARPDLKSAELFALAERMERWVLRGEEG